MWFQLEETYAENFRFSLKPHADLEARMRTCMKLGRRSFPALLRRSRRTWQASYPSQLYVYSAVHKL